jgi:anti-sigma28 factor (negative regulator of flagellin synthesis)
VDCIEFSKRSRAHAVAQPQSIAKESGGAERAKDEDGVGDGVAAEAFWREFFVEQTMSSVNGIGPNVPVQPASNTPRSAESGQAPTARAADRVELSGVSHLMAALKTNDIRVDKVAEIKGQIEAGTYDSDGSKLAGSMDGLLDDLAK